MISYKKLTVLQKYGNIRLEFPRNYGLNDGLKGVYRLVEC